MDEGNQTVMEECGRDVGKGCKRKMEEETGKYVSGEVAGGGTVHRGSSFPFFSFVHDGTGAHWGLSEAGPRVF